MMSAAEILTRRFGRARAACATALVALVLTGCPKLEAVPVWRVVPGPMDLFGVHSLAIGQIEGPGGSEVGHLLAQALMQQGIYEVHDAYATGGAGRADAIVLGSLTDHQVFDDYSWETALTASGQYVTTYRRTAMLALRGMFRVIDLNSGALVAMTTLDHTSQGPTDSVTVEGAANGEARFLRSLFAPVHEGSWMRQAYVQLAQAFCGEVAIDYQAETVQLWHDAADAASCDAVRGARQGDWSAALAAYAAAVADADTNHRNLRAQAHYNYGIALGYSGDLPAGIRELETSYLAERSDVTLDALRRMKGLQRGAEAPAKR